MVTTAMVVLLFLGALTPWLWLIAPDKSFGEPGARHTPATRRSGGPWGVDATRCAVPEDGALRSGHAESSRIHEMRLSVYRTASHARSSRRLLPRGVLDRFAHNRPVSDSKS
jgi:hypothetical protein